MRQFRQILISLAMLMLLLIPARSMAQGVWELVDAVPTTTTFNGIWGSSPTNVFAVGYSGKIVHFDGNSWSEMSSGTSNTLKDIWGSSENDLFAVGSNGTILHYDGSVWSSMASGTNFHFEGVWGSSANDVFAVANYGFDNRIFHYDGISWTEMASGYPGTLYRFWGSAGDNVFLVGTSGQILHYDGLAWSTMASGTSQNLYGIWGRDANNIFAVGYDFTILQFDGTRWTEVASTNHDTLRGVGGGSDIAVHAVGNTGTIQYYDGTNWTPMSSPTTSSLTDVWAASENLAFAVGSSGTILRYSDNDSVPFELQFDVMATKVDTPRSKAYFTAKDARRLYVVDLVTGVTEKYFEFDHMPERMAMSPDGRKLYVALLVQEHSSYWWEEDQSGFIAVLDLDQQAWVDTLSINTDPYDLVVTSSGKLVVSSGSGQWTDIYAYDAQTGAVLGQAGIRQQSRLSLHPSENWVIAADTDLSPSDIEKFDITGPGIVSSGDSPYHGDYRMNGNVWATPDGRYLITRGGDVFWASDMTYVSSITDTGIFIEAVSFDEAENIGLLSLSSNEVLIINLSTLEVTNQLLFTNTVLGAYAFGVNGYYIDGYYVIDGPTGTSITKESHPIQDSDRDGLPDLLEESGCTNPYDADTDEDGLADGDEDADRDGVVDANETDPCSADTDGDGMPDGWEAAYGLDPLIDGSGQDMDNDGLNNANEYLHATDPIDPDSDDDGFNDGPEVTAGSDPKEVASFPKDFIWTGAISSDWGESVNWDIGAAPGNDAIVTLPAGCPPAEHSAVEDTASLEQLEIGGQLTIHGGTVIIGP